MFEIVELKKLRISKNEGLHPSTKFCGNTAMPVRTVYSSFELQWQSGWKRDYVALHV